MNLTNVTAVNLAMALNAASTGSEATADATQWVILDQG